ncbi:MAG: ABC transporter substrate-binding protein [Granulosicoccus sp.]
MNRFVILTVALLLPSVSIAAKDQSLPRVVSINLCTDQMVMLLADPVQIIGLGRLSRDAAGSVFHEAAQDYPQVDPVAEELLPLSPDLVITGPYTSRYTLSLLEELGMQVEILPIANSIEEMLANIDYMGIVLDRQERAAQIVRDVRQRLAIIDLRVRALTGPKPKAAVYDTNGYTVGNKTVRGEIMTLSGWDNVALGQGIESYGVLGLEQLIALKPQALIESPYSEGTYSRGQMLTNHPAIRASGLNPMIISVPSNRTICAGPWVVDVIEQLLEARTLL